MNCYFGIDIGGIKIKIGAIVDKELIDSVILNVNDKNNFYEIISSIESKVDYICNNIRISNKNNCWYWNFLSRNSGFRK